MKQKNKKDISLKNSSEEKKITFLSLEDRQKKLDNFHLGISGWRKIFHQPQKSSSLCQDDISMLTSAFFSLAHFFTEYLEKKNYILVGRDSRKTGEKMAELWHAVSSSMALPCKNVNIMALPEFLSHATVDDLCGGFIYFTASHNPPQDNGIKMGLNDGCILKKNLASKCIDDFRRRYLSDWHKKDVQWINKTKLSKIKTDHDLTEKMHKSYKDLMRNITFFLPNFSSETAEKKEYEDALEALQKECATTKKSIVIDYNGSARIFSCEKEILEDYGIACHFIGNEAGVFSHDIVPEGKSLDDLECSMKKLLNEKKEIFAGIVVDCDGDRGNLLLVSQKKIFRLSAQHTFALTLLSDLCTLKAFFPQRLKKIAIIINEASSLLIDYLCSIYNVKCFRSETGEANVLKLAQKKRNEGYEVRMAGEGSNGGSIVYPHTVRDPLTTLLASIRLLFLKKNNVAIAEQYLEKMNIKNKPNTCFMDDILKQFNRFRSTAVFDEEALVKMDLSSGNNCSIKELKKRLWKKCLENDGKILKDLLNNKKIKVKIKQYLEATEKEIIGEEDWETIEESGGIVIYFYEEKNKTARGFWWMRASQTEPILRCASEWMTEKSDDLSIAKAEQTRVSLQKYLRELIIHKNN